MAAVLCLVMLPMLSAVGFMLLTTTNELTFGSIMAGLAFLIMGAGLVGGMLNMSRAWEGDRVPHE